MKKLILISVLTMMGPGGAWAGAIDGKIEQLKTNAENSRYNQGQYEKNLSTVKGNISELDKALHQLQKMKQQVRDNAKNADANKAQLDKQRVQLEGFIQKENKDIMAEQKKIDTLKEKLKQMEANQEKRQANIKSYQEKQSRIDHEKAQWDDQKKVSGEIEKEIDTKIKQAADEKTQWQAKEKTYKSEADKWDHQARTNEALHKKFKRIQ